MLQTYMWRTRSLPCGLLKDLITIDGLVINSESEKADIFNTFFFESILNVRKKIAQLVDDNINSFGTLFHVRVGRAVEDILGSFAANKSPGYNNIIPNILLTRKSIVSEAITMIFTKILCRFRYPNVIKVHKLVTPQKVCALTEWKMAVQYLCLTTLERFLKELCLAKFRSTSIEMTLFLKDSMDSRKVLGQRILCFNM